MSHTKPLPMLVEALRTAVRQNSHDMLMTGEELRACEAALEAYELGARSTAAQPATLPEPVLQALRFYANGDHYITDDAENFDTVSGEPQNWLCSGLEDSSTMIETGRIARFALTGEALNWIDGGEDHQPKPVAGEAFGPAAAQPVEPRVEFYDVWNQHHSLTIAQAAEELMDWHNAYPGGIDEVEASIKRLAGIASHANRSAASGDSTPPSASSVPYRAISQVLASEIKRAVTNGANSVSMPDELVEIAAWLDSVQGDPSGALRPEPEAVEQGRWQPIETAPKDGTVIDLWIGGEFPRREAECYWGKPHHECGEMGRLCDSDWHDLEDGWVPGHGLFEFSLSDGEITHWMPPPEPPQAASGCSHTARSDGPITKFGIKPHSTLAQLKDDEDLRLYVQAHIEEARSAEQGATPPAPAAPPGHWDEYAMREARRLWNLPAMPKGQLVASLHCALIDAMRFAASPQPAAPEGWKLVPIEATPEMVQAYLRANDAYWHRTDALPDKLGVWRQGTPTEATAESYRAMLAAAPAAEGGAS